MQLVSRKAPTYIRVQLKATCAWHTVFCLCAHLPEMCLQVCMCKSLCAPVLHDRACTLVCLLSERLSLTGHAGTRHDLKTHLVVCCLKNTGLKISPKALALSRFLEQFWHALEKCLIRVWRVSQYWGGRLGVLAMWRNSWAHSSGFATSVERDEDEINEDDVKEIYPALLPPLFKGQHKMKAVSSHSEQWKKVSCS